MPIDIDLSEQENPGVAVQMNRFALIWNDANGLGIADTGRNITLVNGVKIPPGKRYPLKADDQIQFGGTVLQVKVIVKKGTGVQK
jgi:predicted component of type VI protein secretion system